MGFTMLSIIIKEVNSLKAQGVDLLSHCKVLSAVLFEEGGAESHQLSLLTNLLDTVILSNMKDRWFFDLNGDGRFCVKDVRCLLDDVFLPKAKVPTRWIKSIPIKINIFAWKLFLDRLPTRVNLAKRNVAVASLLRPLCETGMEDAAHLFFRCDMAKDVMFLVSRWWDLKDRRGAAPWTLLPGALPPDPRHSGLRPE
nr:RNA-directed DNA polymerase, eukaryota [Tanacetum cinerariifolium]